MRRPALQRRPLFVRHDLCCAVDRRCMLIVAVSTGNSVRYGGMLPPDAERLTLKRRFPRAPATRRLFFVCVADGCGLFLLFMRLSLTASSGNAPRFRVNQEAQRTVRRRMFIGRTSEAVVVGAVKGIECTLAGQRPCRPVFFAIFLFLHFDSASMAFA